MRTISPTVRSGCSVCSGRFLMIQRGGRGRQIILSTHSADLLQDEGIGLDVVLLLQPGNEGTIVRPGSYYEDIKALLDGGLSLAEALIPRTQPKNVQLLALFGT